MPKTNGPSLLSRYWIRSTSRVRTAARGDYTATAGLSDEEA